MNKLGAYINYEMLRAAIHESSHVMVALLHGVEPASVAINYQSGGEVLFKNLSKVNPRAKIQICLSGYVAEYFHYNREKGLQQLPSMIKNHQDQPDFSEVFSTALEITENEKLAFKIITLSCQSTWHLIDNNWDIIVALAKELKQRREISGSEAIHFIAKQREKNSHGTEQITI